MGRNSGRQCSVGLQDRDAKILSLCGSQQRLQVAVLGQVDHQAKVKSSFAITDKAGNRIGESF